MTLLQDFLIDAIRLAVCVCRRCKRFTSPSITSRFIKGIVFTETFQTYYLTELFLDGK